MIDSNTLLIGFPETGKSTYLAALYHYIMSSDPGRSLVQAKPSPDAEYLNKIHNKWLSFEIPGRTLQESKSNRNVTLYLKNPSGKQFTLNIPDIEGEVIKQQWELRSWGNDYKSLVKKANGLLFFINIKSVVNHILISDMLPALDAFLGTESIKESDLLDEKNFDGLKEKWAHDKAPTQVRIVEILQFHLDLMYKSSPLPIGFILSAWDKQIENDDTLKPADWLSVNLPLLYQFLEANKDSIVYETIGISAQGGDYENKEATDLLRKMDEPAQRVKVAVGSQPINNDIALPINWILEKWMEA